MGETLTQQRRVNAADQLAEPRVERWLAGAAECDPVRVGGQFFWQLGEDVVERNIHAAFNGFVGGESELAV